MTSELSRFYKLSAAKQFKQDEVGVMKYYILSLLLYSGLGFSNETQGSLSNHSWNFQYESCNVSQDRSEVVCSSRSYQSPELQSADEQTSRGIGRQVKRYTPFAIFATCAVVRWVTTKKMAKDGACLAAAIITGLLLP